MLSAIMSSKFNRKLIICFPVSGWPSITLGSQKAGRRRQKQGDAPYSEIYEQCALEDLQKLAVKSRIRNQREENNTRTESENFISNLIHKKRAMKIHVHSLENQFQSQHSIGVILHHCSVCGHHRVDCLAALILKRRVAAPLRQCRRQRRKAEIVHRHNLSCVLSCVSPLDFCSLIRTSSKPGLHTRIQDARTGVRGGAVPGAMRSTAAARATDDVAELIGLVRTNGHHVDAGPNPGGARLAQCPDTVRVSRPGATGQAAPPPRTLRDVVTGTKELSCGEAIFPGLPRPAHRLSRPPAVLGSFRPPPPSAPVRPLCSAVPWSSGTDFPDVEWWTPVITHCNKKLCVTLQTVSDCSIVFAKSRLLCKYSPYHKTQSLLGSKKSLSCLGRETQQLALTLDVIQPSILSMSSLLSILITIVQLICIYIVICMESGCLLGTTN